MPYSHVTRTAYGADAIAYARGHGSGHNGEENRNIFVAGVNMLPDEIVPFEQQMQLVWNKADPRHKTQIDRFIVSFSFDELDPDKPEDLIKALDIGCEIAKTIAPDCQAAVFVQTDGAGHKVHIHILVNDVTMTDYKGLDSKAYAHWHFRPIVDEICRRYFDLAQPELAPERINQTVRGSRMKNEQIRAENARELLRAAAEGRAIDQTKIKPEKYIWQDDLRERIKNAARGAADEAGFAQRLRMDGVELVPHKAKDGTISYLHPATKKQPAHYTYELTDVSGFARKIPPNLKSKSFKLGADYQPEGVARLFQHVMLVRPAPIIHHPPAQPAPETDKPDPKEKERQEMENARRAMMRAVWPVFAASMGWGMDRPDDPNEAERRKGLWLNTCGDFERWRVNYRRELKERDKKLAPIYKTDKSTGTISVIEDSLLAQFDIYLHHRKNPGPKETARAESDAEAERQRQRIAAQRAALTAELQRVADNIAERQERAEDNDYTGR